MVKGPYLELEVKLEDRIPLWPGRLNMLPYGLLIRILISNFEIKIRINNLHSQFEFEAMSFGLGISTL